MADIEIIPYIGTRTPADFDTLFDELVAARGNQASLSARFSADESNISGKQDSLSFDGTYNASTNKVATVSTVTNAVSSKQDVLTTAQLAAANSGITAAKLSADEAALAAVYGVCEEILGTSASHKDLDEYKTAGTYFCRNSTNAGYVDNIPATGSGFRLIVENVTTVSTVRQTFFKPTDASRFYVRTFSNNAWGDWYVFEGTVVSRSASALATSAEPETEPETGEEEQR